MAILNLMLLFLAVISGGLAAPATESPQNLSPDSYTPLRQPQQYELPSTDLQLPKLDPPNVPFYVPELMTVLKPPQYNPEVDYYQAPIPAQDLIAPIETVWNPNNDPKYYYTLPSKHYQQPTNEYPKKFSQNLHVKDKPISNRPKIEVELEEINEDQFQHKQKELTKNYDKLAKKENQNDILKVSSSSSSSSQEPKAEASYHTDHFNQGLSTQMLSSLGLLKSPHSDNNERLDFHMVGHDGPHSYKWGYDTGKGHNRQFRFEERDSAGIVKGHFGYYDKFGKLQMVHYDAEPHEGFHAEGNFGRY